jgi:hypothetical protein
MRPMSDGSALVHYLATLAVVLAAGAALGALAGCYARRQRMLASRRLGRLILLAFFTWLAISWAARAYSETGRLGWAAAEWWAHTGKWHVFLAAYVVTAMLALGSAPPGQAARSRFLLGLLALGVVGMVVYRTFPVFALLGDGTRDAKGFLRQSTRHEYACAAVALANYLEQYRGHRPLTEREAARWCRTTVEGTTQSAVLKAALRCGLFQANCRKLDFAGLKQRALPAMVSISTLPGLRHASLLVKLDEEWAWFIDPAYGE